MTAWNRILHSKFFNTATHESKSIARRTNAVIHRVRKHNHLLYCQHEHNKCDTNDHTQFITLQRRHLPAGGSGTQQAWQISGLMLAVELVVLVLASRSWYYCCLWLAEWRPAVVLSDWGCGHQLV